MKFSEKIINAKLEEEMKEDTPFKVSDLQINKMKELNLALKEIESEILSIPAILELGNRIASEIEVNKNKDSLKIIIGYEETMDDYFIACEDTSFKEYEYYESADSIDEAIDLIAEIIGKFITRTENRS